MALKEKALIRYIRRMAARSPRLQVGIGDDCALMNIPKAQQLLVTTDFSLEGIHFRREWHPADAVGHRCLTRGLSDIAAMGGEPLAIFLSLALPRDASQQWVRQFMNGLLKLARSFEVPLAGGDTAQSPAGIMADIIVLGSCPQGKAILRSGAKPGDYIYVTGELGGSAAAVTLLLSGQRKKLRIADYPSHFYPEPRVAVGRFLRQHGLASSMIDVSDGLSTDLSHISEESGVGAQIWADALPIASIGRPARKVELSFALHGGEAYELLFTAPAKKPVPNRIAGVQITKIGKIVAKPGMMLVDANGRASKLVAKGWEHFVS